MSLALRFGLFLLLIIPVRAEGATGPIWLANTTNLVVPILSGPLSTEGAKGTTQSADPVPSPGIAGTQDDIVFPHIATYKIMLDKNNTNNELDDVNGFMTIKILDTEDGWVYEYTSSLLIYWASGEVEQVNTNVATWQDYPGNHYRFNSRTLRNGQEEDVIRGEAHRGAENAPGKVIYKLPNVMEINIPNETIFPLHHLINAVRQARTGKNVVSNVVFDGSAETQEAVSVDTIISAAKTLKVKLENPLPAGITLNKVWAMELGVYPLNSNKPEPEYVIKQDVLDHCIINTMTLDYGDFQVVATLDKIEFFT